jgi:hypothetical protein
LAFKQKSQSNFSGKQRKMQNLKRTMLVILATWEAEIRRIVVQGQLGQIVLETPISKITRAKCTGGVAQAMKL